MAEKIKPECSHGTPPGVPCFYCSEAKEGDKKRSLSETKLEILEGLLPALTGGASRNDESFYGGLTTPDKIKYLEDHLEIVLSTGDEAVKSIIGKLINDTALGTVVFENEIIIDEDQQDVLREYFIEFSRSKKAPHSEEGIKIDSELNKKINLLSKIFDLQIEIRFGIQEDDFSDEQLQIIKDKLIDERTVMRASKEELEEMLSAINDLKAHVNLDLMQVFVEDQSKKDALLQVLVGASLYVEGALGTKDERDNEQISAKDYLKEEIEIKIKEIEYVVSTYVREEAEIKKGQEAVSQISELIEIIDKIPSSLNKSRKYLRLIMDLMLGSVQVSSNLGRDTSGINLTFDKKTVVNTRVAIEALV